MANLGQTQSGTLAKPKKSLAQLLDDVNVKGRFRGILGSRAPGFISSILNTTNSSTELKKVASENPESIVRSAAVAAALDLPIDRNLGFAWIVPYKSEAQFQLGYRGYIQLALRTGQYKKITAIPVHVNQFKSWNPLTETLDADFSIDGEGSVVGFAVYFELVNGYTKTAYFTKAWLLAHGKKYSRAFNSGPWQSHQEEMCLKTAIKLTLSKWGILSIEMQTALKADQAVVKSDDLDDPDAFAYVDNPERETIDTTAEVGK
jgi:recombination protein RecT